MVERHWYKLHAEPPPAADQQVPVLFRARMMQRLKEEGTVEEAKNDEMEGWRQIKYLISSCRVINFKMIVILDQQ